MSQHPLDHFWAVVPAGGAGTRLWPLSRSSSPKFLHDLTGSGRTLLQDTYDRLRPLVGDRLLVVTGAAHRDAVVQQLAELDQTQVVAEPSARDSMAAIGLAAALLERRDPAAVMGSFAADHVITDPEEFRRVVARAAQVAADDWLVIIGIEPTGPATGFGYIAAGEPLGGAAGEPLGGGAGQPLGSQHAFAVRDFVEKPNADLAATYVEQGYRWNAGMFVVRPGVLLDLLADNDPGFAAALRSVATLPDTLAEVWPTLPAIALDHAVAEPAAAAGRVAVVPGSFGWDDIGDFSSLRPLVPAEGPMSVLGDAALVRSIDSDALVVPASGRLVAVIGLDDIVVVDTPDALLVTTRERAQEVKQVVAELKASGQAGLT